MRVKFRGMDARKLGSFFIELVQVVVFAVSIFLFVYLLVLQPHKIKGESMEPNFHNGEYLLTDKVSYRIGDPKRGDVIVFKAPPSHKDEFIKRILGLPGDTVKVENGTLYINGHEVHESYLPSDFKTRSKSFAQEGKELVVPDNSYFVMGDNRDRSLDSRDLGFIERKYITGRAWIMYWPLSRAGVVHAPTYDF